MKIYFSQIDQEIKSIAKRSTAPDKETPDWMETDIRNGMERALELAGFEKLHNYWTNEIRNDY